jgi:hypothetical protein
MWQNVDFYMHRYSLAVMQDDDSCIDVYSLLPGWPDLVMLSNISVTIVK